MSWHARLRNVFRSEKLSRDLDDELAFHLSERADELERAGCTRNEAIAKARLQLGNYTIQKERTREMNITAWLDTVLADFSFGLRQLRLNPGFTVVSVLSLALGIGANTAIFQLIDAIRLRGLPVTNPWELVALDARSPRDFFTQGQYSSRERAFTSAQMDAMRDNQQAFSDFLVFNPTRLNLSDGGQTRYAETLLVSDNFLRVLGISPVMGHDFAAADKSCSAPGAILDYAFWQREFGGDLQAIGKTVSLEGHRVPVIGVTPPSFYGVEPGQRFDLAVPLCVDRLLAENGKSREYRRVAWWLTPIGRLKPGWTLERASQHLTDISPAIFRASMPSEYRPAEAKRYLGNRLRGVSASAGVSSIRREYENPLWILLGITALVLLIACANLANLLLARASAREREIGIRQALGASRPRILLQLFSESLLLAALGGILGAAIAQILSRGLVLFLSNPANRLTLTVGIDWRVFAFTASLAATTCLLFGLVPAIRASGASPAGALRGSRTSTASRERNALRRALVVSQVALSLVLLVAALLFTRSLQKMFASAVGFESQNVLVASVTARDLRPADPARRTALFREIETRISGLPGVRSAAEVMMSPMSGYGWNQRVHGDGDAATTNGKWSWFNRSSPGYFATMATPMLGGRDFTAQDNAKAPPVAIVNQAFARQYFGARNPVGRTFRVEREAGEKDRIFQVVGVVANTKYRDLHEKEEPIVFLPVAQNDEPGTDQVFVVRGRGPLDAISHSIQLALRSIDPGLLVEFKVLDVQIRESALRDRLMANLTAGFGFLAACLSTLGLYGVMSYLVVRRRGEIGVRLALGASRGNVFALILRDASLMVVIGLAVGLIAAVLLSRYAESLLFGLTGTDPLTLILAAGLLSLTALGATLLPAGRAARLQPLSTLREE